MSAFFRNSFYIVYSIFALLFMVAFCTPGLDIPAQVILPAGTFTCLVGFYIIHHLSDRDHYGFIRATALFSFAVAAFPAALATIGTIVCLPF